MEFQAIIDRGKVRGVERLSLDDCAILDRTAREIGAKVIVEIGAAAGTSTMVLGAVAKAHGGTMLSIDPRPETAWSENIAWAGLVETCAMERASSPWVRHLLDAKLSIDYLLIDGEHKTRWALVDYHCWAPKVRKGGRIAFHDIYGPRGPDVNAAIELILRDDGAKLREVARGRPARDRGVIVFEKT